MAKESQYTDDYLATNTARGMGNGLTVGTFLAYVLRGRAKEYKGRYETALINSLERRQGVVKSKSARGGVAWYLQVSVSQ